jgi:hypothetical protein
MQTPNDSIGNGTRDRPAYTALSQTTEQTRAPKWYCTFPLDCPTKREYEFFPVAYGEERAIWSSSSCSRVHTLVISSLWALCSQKPPLIKNGRTDSRKQEKIRMKNIWKSLRLSCYLFPLFTSHPCFVYCGADRRSGCDGSWNESRALQSPVSTYDTETTNFIFFKKTFFQKTNQCTYNVTIYFS